MFRPCRLRLLAQSRAKYGYAHRKRRVSQPNSRPRRSPNSQWIPRFRNAFLTLQFHINQAYDATLQKSRGKKESDAEYDLVLSSYDNLQRMAPGYVPAHLAFVRHVLDMPRAELGPKAGVALQAALAADEQDPEVHRLLGMLVSQYQGQWEAAGDEYRRAVELAPDSAENHEAYAEYLDDLGRFDAGMQEHRKAQALDPQNDYISSSPLTPVSEKVRRKHQYPLRYGAYDYWWRGNAEFEAGQYRGCLPGLGARHANFRIRRRGRFRPTGLRHKWAASRREGAGTDS